MYLSFWEVRYALKSASTRSSTLKSLLTGLSFEGDVSDREPVPAICAPPCPSAASNVRAKFTKACRPMRCATNLPGVSGSTQ